VDLKEIMTCCSVWPALVSALFFNLNSFLFAPLFTNFMGLGDKETFAFALIAHGMPFSTVKYRTIAVGTPHRVCKLGGLGGCWCAFLRLITYLLASNSQSLMSGIVHDW
jgi:hypothetical protein